MMLTFFVPKPKIAFRYHGDVRKSYFLAKNKKNQQSTTIPITSNKRPPVFIPYALIGKITNANFHYQI